MLVSVCYAGYNDHNNNVGTGNYAHHYWGDWGYDHDNARVRVAGSGSVTVTADIATIYATISEDAPTVSAALDKLEAVLNAVECLLKENNISKDNLVTSFISVFPKYDYSSGNPCVTGYTATLSITITVSGIDKPDCVLGKLIEGLVCAGVTSITGVTYDSSCDDANEVAARKAAFADAKAKACQYAELAGAKVGDVKSIDETNVFYAAYDSLANNSQLEGSMNGNKWGYHNDPSLELPAGQVTTTVDVIIVWELICV